MQVNNNDNVTYNVYTGIWANDITDMFSCNESVTRNTTFDEWCIFDTYKDAFNYCEGDKLCRGFVVYGKKHQIVHKPVVPSTTNGTFYEKDSFTEKDSFASSGNSRRVVIFLFLFLIIVNVY